MCFFLLDVLAKGRVRIVMIELKDVEYDVIVPSVATFDFFHPDFDLFIFKDHVVVKIFYLHLSQVDFMLLIPVQIMGLTMDRMWWIIMVPSELVLLIWILEKYFMIRRQAFMVSEFRTHCATIMEQMQT